MDSRYAPLVETLVKTVLEGPGELDAQKRKAAMRRGELPEPIAGLVAKIHRNAWKVTDEDVAAASAAGWSRDQLFELIVCASVGASLERLEAGLRAMGGGR
jgi:hypothetical protein